jgi:hypothetical protein
VFVIPADFGGRRRNSELKNGEDRIVVPNRVARSVIEECRGQDRARIDERAHHRRCNSSNRRWVSKPGCTPDVTDSIYRRRRQALAASVPRPGGNRAQCPGRYLRSGARKRNARFGVETKGTVVRRLEACDSLSHLAVKQSVILSTHEKRGQYELPARHSCSGFCGPATPVRGTGALLCRYSVSACNAHHRRSVCRRRVVSSYGLLVEDR